MLDDRIIDWSLQMVREHGVDFIHWELNPNHRELYPKDRDLNLAITRWFKGVFWCMNRLFYKENDQYDGDCDFYLMRSHVEFLIGDAIPPKDNENYETVVGERFEHDKRRFKRNRCDMVMYGLLLYALRRTDYKRLANDDGTDDGDEWLSDFEKKMEKKKLGVLAEDAKRDYLNDKRHNKQLGCLSDALHPLLLALANEGDFQTGFDYTDMPLEFTIEDVKASVPEYIF